MEKGTIKLLEQILDNQVILFKRLDDIECMLKNRHRSAPLTNYEKELETLNEKLKEQRINFNK